MAQEIRGCDFRWRSGVRTRERRRISRARSPKSSEFREGGGGIQSSLLCSLLGFFESSPDKHEKGRKMERSASTGALVGDLSKQWQWHEAFRDEMKNVYRSNYMDMV